MPKWLYWYQLAFSGVPCTLVRLKFCNDCRCTAILYAGLYFCRWRWLCIVYAIPYWRTMAAVQNGNRCVSSPQGSTRCAAIEKWDLMRAVCCLRCIVRVSTRALLDVKMGPTYIRYSMKWQYGVTGRTLANDPAPSGGQCASLPPRSPRLSMVSHAAVMVPVTLPFTGAKHEHYAHNDAFIPVMTRKNVYKLVFWKSLRGFFFFFSSRAAGLH